MTDPHVAITLIQEVMRAVTATTKTQGGRGFKGAMAREQRAKKRLFIALTGRKPSAEELQAIWD